MGQVNEDNTPPVEKKPEEVAAPEAAPEAAPAESTEAPPAEAQKQDAPVEGKKPTSSARNGIGRASW